MKTQVTLSSSDRELFGITIRQNTDAGFLSVSDLQQAYEVARWEYGWSDLDISSLMQGDRFKARCYYLLENKGIINTDFPGFMDQCKNEGFIKVLKKLNVWKTTGARENKQVMCDPYIWVLVAMELNPMIYAKVVIWLTDSLIFNRIEAGTEYMPMNAKIKDIVEAPNYPLYATLINKKVFGFHQPGMRNLASSKELRKISDVEKQVIIAIEMNWIRDEQDLIKFLEK